MPVPQFGLAPTMNPQMPQPGQTAQNAVQNKQQIFGPTPPQAPGVATAPAQAAPPITANSIWSDQDIQNQINQSRARSSALMQTNQRRIDQQNAARGVNPNSPEAQAQKQRMMALNTSNQMMNENNLRFQTAQQRAEHLLNTQQAGSNQYFQQLQDELARGQLNQQGWLGAQNIGMQQAGLGAGLAESEAARQQQMGMSQLTNAQDVFKAQLGDISAMERLQAQLGSNQQMQQAQFGFQGGENQLDRALQQAMQQAGIGSQQFMQGQDIAAQMARLQAQLGFQGGEGAAQRALQERMQGTDIAGQERMQQAGFGNQQAMQAADIANQQAMQQAGIGATAEQGEAERALKTQLQGSDIAAQQALQQASLGSQAALQSQALGSQATQAEAERALREKLQGSDIASQQAMQQAALGSQAALQGQQLGAQQAMQQAELGSKSQLQAADIAAQQALQQGQFGFQGAQADLARQAAAALQAGQIGSQEKMQQAELGSRAGLQTQQLGTQVGMQQQDIQAQMARLLASLQSQQGIAGNQNALQWALGNLQNQRDILTTGMNNYTSAYGQSLQAKTALQQQQLQNQQAQWAQQLQAANALKMQANDANQQDVMARLQNTLGQNAYANKAQIDYQQALNLAKQQSNLGMQGVQNQAAWNQWQQQQQYNRELPLNQANANIAQYNAITGRMPYTPQQNMLRVAQPLLSGMAQGWNVLNSAQQNAQFANALNMAGRMMGVLNQNPNQLPFNGVQQQPVP